MMAHVLSKQATQSIFSRKDLMVYWWTHRFGPVLPDKSLSMKRFYLCLSYLLVEQHGNGEREALVDGRKQTTTLRPEDTHR
jgi:hypothetical protein